MVTSGTRLVVIADDFGSSSSVNHAVADAYENGIVTGASLMPAGAAFDEAVRIAHSTGLSVGLHVTLCDGKPVLPPHRVPDLVDAGGMFEKSPVRAWMSFSRSSALAQAEHEIKAQFDLLENAGIHPTHVDGHHHLHMHPAIFSIVCRKASRRGVRWVRVPREPFSMVLAGGRGALPLIEWTVFRTLAGFHIRTARRYGLNTADRVYGLARTGGLDEDLLLEMLNARGEVMEIFAHPDTATPAGRRELDALIATSVRAKIASLGIVLTGYRDLKGTGTSTGTKAAA